jgi:hypothetical protein
MQRSKNEGGSSGWMATHCKSYAHYFYKYALYKYAAITELASCFSFYE